MAKYRLCGGLAMTPSRDMKLLKKMSAQGWHVVCINNLLCYRFEKGEPHAYDYALSYESSFAPDVEQLYQAGGWTVAFAIPGWQILRAEAGTTPLFTDKESEIEALSDIRRRTGLWALLWLAALLACGIWAYFSPRNALIGIAVAASALACNALPYIGYTRSIVKLRESVHI